MKKSQRNFSAKALAFTAILALAASPAAADFVINDDLIVDGSACIGFDCVNGEVFGFDTIRLKENNLRIKFDDTSVAASFPRNDWQLTANDSANGGASKFSIDDISGNRTPFTVEANARNHSLYVDDGGRIGNRTSTPSTEIHTVDGDTPTLRLQQDSSSGFAPQTWDVAGNETNFFVRDVTNGSALPFRIRPGAPTSSIMIDESGDIGVGTTSPDADFHLLRTTADNTTEFKVQGNGAAFISLQNDAHGGTWFTTYDSAGNYNIAHSTTGGAALAITPAGDVTIRGDCLDQGNPGPAVACDGVFEPAYEIPTIEEHAASMWENRYLPAIGPTPEGKTVSLSLQKRHYGMLNELEKAHIYIEQLNEIVTAREEVITKLLERVERLEQR